MPRKQIPVVGEMTGNLSLYDVTNAGYEDGTKYVNGYFEQYKSVTDNYKNVLDSSQRFEFIKRPGIENVTIDGLAPAPTGTNPVILDGCRSSGSGAAVYLAWLQTTGNTAQFSVGNTVFAAPGGWTSGLGIQGTFCVTDAISLAAFDCAFTDGTNGALLNGAGVTRIADADYIAFMGGGAGINMEYMDGYLFQGNFSTNRVFNSDINAPTSWQSTSYITVNIHPGVLVCIKRARQYLVCFKEHSTEFLENVGNPTPGSPLSPVKQLAQEIGCLHTSYVKKVSDGIIFVGTIKDGIVGVYKLDYSSLSIKKISDSYVDGILQVTGALDGLQSGGGITPNTNLHCNVVPWKGHEFYVLPIKDRTNAAIRFSVVYDNSNDSWVLWTRSINGGIAGFYNTCVIGGSATVQKPTDIYLGPSQFEKGKPPLHLSEESYTDYDVSTSTPQSITVKWCSPTMDFGTLRRKFMSSLELYYKLGSGNGGNGTVTMHYYDDDNVTPTTNRTANTSTAGGRIKWTQLGSFHHRRFVLQTTSSTPFRIGVVEADIQISDQDLD